jgi:hypothetical protein
MIYVHQPDQEAEEHEVGPYVPRCHEAEEYNLCSSAQMSMRSYVRQDMFLSWPRNISYVPRP